MTVTRYEVRTSEITLHNPNTAPEAHNQSGTCASESMIDQAASGIESAESMVMRQQSDGAIVKLVRCGLAVPSGKQDTVCERM